MAPSPTADGDASPSEQQSVHKPSKFKSDIIAVLVGPSKVRFSVHKDVICQECPFFRACLGSGMLEARSGQVELPEDDPTIFEKLLEWVYGSRNTIKEPKEGDWIGISWLASLYVLADRLGMEELANGTMDQIKEWHAKNYVCCAVLEQVCDVASDQSKLKKFLIEQLAYDLWFQDTWRDIHRVHEDVTAQVHSFFKSGRPEILQVMTFLNEQLHSGDKNWTEPCSREPCDWHTHVTTEKCKYEVKGPRRSK